MLTSFIIFPILAVVVAPVSGRLDLICGTKEITFASMKLLSACLFHRKKIVRRVQLFDLKNVENNAVATHPYSGTSDKGPSEIGTKCPLFRGSTVCIPID